MTDQKEGGPHGELAALPLKDRAKRLMSHGPDIDSMEGNWIVPS